ncbi:receptor activity-modifying protein 2 isoform X2 [Morone saxatilis]|uniref:receptor activity-modifying protein 2 isoform X2 n=1 Tax=Morone saxatilis TaxID=34816 RepID=UPI0015E23B12|nr:receptor activity-modifying protein 2 isoform X2 [Morone saxatilis]
MTAPSFSLIFSGYFVALLIWGCTTVVCLVDENVAMQPVTTIDTTNGQSTLPFACGNNSHLCMEYCEICLSISGGPTMDCLSIMFDHVCLLKFNNSMASLNNTEWCIWRNVSGLYSDLSYCTEEISDCLLIPWPNPLVEKTFVDIHAEFFKDCPTEELSDPSPSIVFALVITPICLIPIMVSLVVLKTKNGDGSS